MGHEDEVRTLGALDLEGSGFAKRESEKVCKVCERPVSVWPMAFRGDEVCSVLCEKYKGPVEDVQASEEDIKGFEALSKGGKPKKPKKKALVQMGADE